MENEKEINELPCCELCGCEIDGDVFTFDEQILCEDCICRRQNRICTDFQPHAAGL